MPLLLTFDSATELASVCIAHNGVSLAYLQNPNQKDHASFIHTAIADLLEKTGNQLRDFDGFAVTSGPGSYTGLRVGMATAKGFCYALSKPLIAINTLEVMTKAALDAIGKVEDLLFCPMIDARRMEVFTALYNGDMKEIVPPASVILGERLFNNYLVNNKIIFFGSGSEKFRKIGVNSNSFFTEVHYNANHLASLADVAFQEEKFMNISYSEPTYFKEFHSIKKTY